MNESPLRGLIIRTAVVRRPELGFIYACDPEKEKEEIPHAIIFKWKAGIFTQGECYYDAHTVCQIEYPEPGLVDTCGAGYYTVSTRSGVTTDDIFENSQPPPKRSGYVGFRSVSEIEGRAYAVGLRGMVYRLDAVKKWTRIDDGLPDSFDVQAIHGFDGSNIYAVGRQGELWHYDGKEWTKEELPTNRNLTAVKCGGDGIVYAGGYGGTLLRGTEDAWETIDQENTEEDVWDLEWFEGQLYVSTMEDVHRLKGDELESVDFGDHQPESFYQLSAAKGVMWSVGEHDIMSYDGKKWTRIV